MAEIETIEIPSKVIRLALHKIVENRLKSTNNRILVSLASKSGTNNFIGIVYRATFSKKNDRIEDENSTHTFIVKVAPQQLERRQRFQVRPLFLREIFMYEKILPYFRQFEQSKGIAMDGFVEYPICYRSIDDDFNECVILEDLNVGGFKMIDRFTEEVTVDHVRLMMQILGKFHAISIALKAQLPEKFIELTSNLNELYIRPNDKQLRDYFNMMAKSVLDALSNDDDAFVRSKITKLFEKDAIDIAADCIDAKSIDSIAITHADIWQNNTMFKYDESGKPIEVRLLDWQMARCSSPVLDIVYCIFCCTTKELRDEHYDEFLKIYHESLSLHIRNLGSNPEKLFSCELMMEHLRKFGKFGLIMASTLLPTITASRESVMNLDDTSSNENSSSGELSKLPKLKDHPLISDSSLNRFNKRVRDIAIDNGSTRICVKNDAMELNKKTS